MRTVEPLLFQVFPTKVSWSSVLFIDTEKQEGRIRRFISHVYNKSKTVYPN